MLSILLSVPAKGKVPSVKTVVPTEAVKIPTRKSSRVNGGEGGTNSKADVERPKAATAGASTVTNKPPANRKRKTTADEERPNEATAGASAVTKKPTLNRKSKTAEPDASMSAPEVTSHNGGKPTVPDNNVNNPAPQGPHLTFPHLHLGLCNA